MFTTSQQSSRLQAYFLTNSNRRRRLPKQRQGRVSELQEVELYLSSRPFEEQIENALDSLLVKSGLEILKCVTGRISTEVDARLSFDECEPMIFLHHVWHRYLLNTPYVMWWQEIAFILQMINVSTVDPEVLRLLPGGTIAKAHQIIELYDDAGIDRSRVLIKVRSLSLFVYALQNS